MAWKIPSVRVCSRGFCRIAGGIEDCRKPPTSLDRTGPRFGYLQLLIGIEHIDDIKADLDQALATV